MGRHVGRQLAGRWHADRQAGWKADWPVRCINLPLAVSRLSFGGKHSFVDCVKYITLLAGMCR